MNYLKDIIIESKYRKIEKQKIKYYMPNHISPYLEINEQNLNLLTIDNEKENLIGVNPYFRNEKIFWDFLSPNLECFKGIKDLLFNILCHLIAETDYYYIQRLSDFDKKLIENAVLSNDYGEEIRDIYLGFLETEKKYVIEELYKMYKLGLNMERLISIVNELFPGNISYDYKEEKDVLSIFLPYKENDVNKRKFELIQVLFVPINLKVKIYWQYHFMVIGIDEMSKLDNCKIF